MEQPGRPDEDAIPAKPESFGVECGIGIGGVCESLCGGDRYGDEWVGGVAFFYQWHRGDQADSRIVEPERDHPDIGNTGYGGADGADGEGCGIAAGGIE